MRILVAALLRLFPRRFRRDFAREMIATFDDQWQEHHGLRAGIRVIRDLIWAIALERICGWPDPIRRPKGDSLMTILWQDLRFAARTLWRSPGFTIVALLVLGLGVGVNTAMFSVAYAVLWRSLPYPHPNRLVMVGEVEAKHPDAYWGASYLNFQDWRSRATSFEHLAGILNDERILREAPEPVRLSGLAVTHDFFDVMNVAPALGRVFGSSEDCLGRTPVVVLSHRIWTERFAGDPAILGRSLHFDSFPFTVIGVMPAGFEYRQAEYWVPLEQVVGDYFRARRTVWVFTAIGRLREGVNVAAAQTEIEGIAEQIRRAFPDTNRGLVVRVDLLRNELSRDLRPALEILLGAVVLVLLIACANLAALMLVRATGRGREMAIRSALGVSRRRLLSQLLTENALLACAGGLAGVALSFCATRWIALFTQDPRLLDVHIDAPVLLFAALVTLATTILFGVGPAVRSARTDLSVALKSGSPASACPDRAFAQRALVVSEVALCLVLLVSAGLLLKSLHRVFQVQPGFRPENLLTMRINLPSSYQTVAAAAQFYNRVRERLPNATLVSRLPISGGEANGDINIEGRPAAPGSLGASTFRRILPNYFAVMGIPLLRGRAFDDRDDGSRGRVVIINDGFARRFWPNTDPIGARIKIGPADAGQWLTIVGVVGDVHQIGLDSEPSFSTYEPLIIQPSARFDIAFRNRGGLDSAISSVRHELRAMEPALLIDHAATMAQRIDDSVAPRRLNLLILILFAALALVLAAIGLYGVVAYAAGLRRAEFGIRMALGARPGDVMSLVLRQGLKLVAIGIFLGLAATLMLARLFTRLLFGVDPADTSTLSAVSLILAVVAVAACWLPAYRATRIAPVEALRTE